MSHLAVLALAACSPETDRRPHRAEEVEPPPPTDTAVSPPAAAPTGDTGAAPTDTAPPPDCSFSACGNDFTGTWIFTATACAGGTIHDIVGADCQDFRYTSQNLWEGTLDLRADGSYTLEASAWTSLSTYLFPAECNPTTCADLSGEDGFGSCVDDGSGGCTCDQVYEIGPTSTLGEWWIDDNYTYYGPPRDPELNLGQLYPNGSMAWGIFRWCATASELRFTDKFDNVWVLTRAP
jgi:hypothetical protein